MLGSGRILRGRRRRRALGAFPLPVLMFGLEPLTPGPLRSFRFRVVLFLIAAWSVRRLRVVRFVVTRFRVRAVVARLRVLRMPMRLVAVILLRMRCPVSGCGVVRVVLQPMMLERLVLFLLVTVRSRCVMRRVGVTTGTRMRMMRSRFRRGVLFTLAVTRVRVRVGGVMTAIFFGWMRSAGRVRVRVVSVAALAMTAATVIVIGMARSIGRARVVRVAALMMTVFGIGRAVLVILPLRLIVTRRCTCLLVPVPVRVRPPVLVPLLLLRLAVMRSPLLLLGGSFRLCLLFLRLTSFPLSPQVVQNLLVFCMFSIACAVVFVVVVVMRLLVLRVSVPMLLRLVSVRVLLLLALISVLRLIVRGVCGASSVSGFVSLVGLFVPPIMRCSGRENLALALQPDALVLCPLPRTLRRPVLLLLLGLALLLLCLVLFLLFLALPLLFCGVVIMLLMAVVMFVTMSGSQHHHNVRRHRRRLCGRALQWQEWQHFECIGRRGGDRGRGKILSSIWICTVERHLGTVDERSLLIHLSRIPALLVQALVSRLSHIVDANEGSSARQIPSEVVDDDKGESEDAKERYRQGADGIDCEGTIRASVVVLIGDEGSQDLDNDCQRETQREEAEKDEVRRDPVHRLP